MKNVVESKEVKAANAVKVETRTAETLAYDAKNAVEVVKGVVKTEEKLTESIAQKMEKVARSVDVPAQETKLIETSSERKVLRIMQ